MRTPTGPCGCCAPATPVAAGWPGSRTSTSSPCSCACPTSPPPRASEPSGPIARLREYDRAHRSHLTETLAAWLDSAGDAAAAAAATHVHVNTFRYRLRRIAEVGGIDLDDPDFRFAAMLQLRLLRD